MQPLFDVRTILSLFSLLVLMQGWLAGSLVRPCNVSSVSCNATLLFPYSEADRHAMSDRQGLFQLVPLSARIMLNRTLESGQIPENRLVTRISLFYGLQTVLFCRLRLCSY